MKMLHLIIIATPIAVLSSSCAQIQAENKQHQAEQARDEAIRAGNSGPLYNHYMDCLESYWREALDAGKPTASAFQAGVNACSYELNLLCDYYQVNTCYEDARMSNQFFYADWLDSYSPGLSRR